ncbi:MAG: alpha-D-ribose 1-methylphosphonate 5-triphosphate diphosphatase [Pseudomonadota bacterium]
MTDLRFTGARVIGPEDEGEVLSIHGGLIGERGGKDVDLRGYIVLPGIVDVHGDGFERHLAPRRGAMKEMAEGLVATESELAANGITTGVLAQFVSWEGGLRGLEFADQVFHAIRSTAPLLVTDVRAQLRFETHLLELYEDLPALIAEWDVRYVVFNDHLPHDRLAAGKHPPRMVGQALKAGRNPDTHFAHLLALHRGSSQVPDALDTLCRRLREAGVRLGSHDDATKNQRAAAHARGMHVAEFPETMEAAEAAKAAGDYAVLGAPNVVRGGSHKGNVSAIDLVSLGLCDAIASDYHYPSPRRAALLIARSGILSLPAAWQLVSAGPAALLGLSDRGTLTPGKRADIVILDAKTHRVAATLVAGRFSYLNGAIADRFFAA